MEITHVGFLTKTTLCRGWGEGLLFWFRGDDSSVHKLENIWNCLNSFVWVVGQYGSTPVRRMHVRLLSLD